MRTMLVAFATLVSAIPLPALAQDKAPPPALVSPQVPVHQLSRAEALADIKLMRQALETVHPGLYRRASERDVSRALDGLERGIDGPVTDIELYRRISAVLAMIRCTHTKADQPKQIEDWRMEHPSHLPFRFRIVEGRMLVVSSEPAQPALARGAEVLTINGRPVAQLIRSLGAYVPIDGNTEESRLAYLGHDGDLMGADFDHFYPYVFGFPDRLELTVRDNDSAPRRALTLSPVPFRKWLKLDYDGRAYRQDFADAKSWRMLDEKIGYLRIDTFVNYRRPIDARERYATALTELTHAGADKLIVDLRNNGGGSNDAALALIDALTTVPYTYQRAMRYRTVRYGDLPNFISSWGDRGALFNPPLDRFTRADDGWFDLRPEFATDELLPRQPAPGAFTGPVTVLTGPANASGATMVIAKLRDMGRVRLVGERSGGSADGPTAGTIFNVALPNSGISVRVPVMFNRMDVARFDPRGGINPDVPVKVTVEDFRANRDPVLEVALADLKRTITP